VEAGNCQDLVDFCATKLMCVFSEFLVNFYNLTFKFWRGWLSEGHMTGEDNRNL